MMIADQLTVLDAASCKLWLSQMVPNDSARALMQFEGLLAQLARQPLAPEAELGILERLRPAVFAALRAEIKQLEDGAVPFDESAVGGFLTLQRVLEQLREAYVALVPRLQDSLVPAELYPLGMTAHVLLGRHLALARALDCQGFLLLAHWRGRCRIEPRHWDAHARLAEVAQALNALDDRIPDALQADKFDTCRAAIVHPWLVHLTGPQRLTRPMLRLARVCARAWARKVSFQIDPLTAPGVVLEGPVFPIGQRYQVRLDTARLNDSVRKRIAALQAGQTPEALGFPLRIDSAACLAGLNLFADSWGHVGEVRRAWREINDQQVQGAWGFGRAALTPVGQQASGITNAGSADNFAATSASTDPTSLFDARELWRFTSEGALGLGFVRPITGPAPLPGQLVGLTFDPQAAPCLGHIVGWQQVLPTDATSLPPASEMTVQLLAGTALRVCLTLSQGQRLSALLLRQADTTAAPRLVLPTGAGVAVNGSFETQLDGALVRGRFGAQLEHGVDYELRACSLT